MLGKLIKQEFKAVSPLLIMLHAALFVMTFFEHFLIALNIFDTLPKLGNIFTVFYVIALIAVSIITFLFFIYRFYRNLFSDEGYLMHTLPVKPYQLILSKLITAVVWCIIDGLIVIGSILLLVLSSRQYDITFVLNYLQAFIAETSLSAGVLFFHIIAFGLLQIIYNLVRFYSALTIGHTFSKHKLLGSFGAYIVIYIIIESITTLVLYLSGIFATDYSDTAHLKYFVDSTTVISYLITIGFAILLYLISNYILNRRLNLE